jgi:hypothetical protein
VFLKITLCIRVNIHVFINRLECSKKCFKKFCEFQKYVLGCLKKWSWLCKSYVEVFEIVLGVKRLRCKNVHGVQNCSGFKHCVHWSKKKSIDSEKCNREFIRKKFWSVKCSRRQKILLEVVKTFTSFANIFRGFGKMFTRANTKYIFKLNKCKWWKIKQKWKIKKKEKTFYRANPPASVSFRPPAAQHGLCVQNEGPSQGLFLWIHHC